jgi:hypothetical protein
MEKIRIRDGKNSDPGWKKFGSATLVPDRDPQHRINAALFSWLFACVLFITLISWQVWQEFWPTVNRCLAASPKWRQSTGPAGGRPRGNLPYSPSFFTLILKRLDQVISILI